MAKKLGRHIGATSGPTSGEHISEQEREEEQVPTEADDVYEHIESLKERFGEGEQGRVQVMRRMADGTIVNLPSLPALTFDIDVVAARYGGGRYEFKFYKGREYLGRDSFAIDESVKPTPEVVAVKEHREGDAPSWLAATLDKMGEAIKAMAERPAPTPPTPPDPIAMITALATAAKAMMPAAAATPAMGLKDQIDMIKSVIDVGTTVLDARNGGGGNDTGDAMVDMVSKLADPVIDLVKIQATREAERRQPARNPVTRPRLVPTPATAAAALPKPPVPPTEAPVPITWVQEIQKWVPLIVKRAQRARSAEDTAFFVLDELSDVTLKKLAEIAALPDFASRAAGILPPELGEYPEWTTEFLAAVQDYLFGEDDDGDINSALDALPPVEPEGSDPDPVAVDVTPEKEPVPTS